MSYYLTRRSSNSNKLTQRINASGANLVIIIGKIVDNELYYIEYIDDILDKCRSFNNYYQNVYLNNLIIDLENSLVSNIDEGYIERLLVEIKTVIVSVSNSTVIL